mmetsp:Transcript_14161/g.36011  ORF Transcript_14161/g.36011 Transcript_14161/m.36011 type:complete len:234 (-) Transcript_14161:14-715(-)
MSASSSASTSSSSCIMLADSTSSLGIVTSGIAASTVFCGVAPERSKSTSAKSSIASASSAPRTSCFAGVLSLGVPGVPGADFAGCVASRASTGCGASMTEPSALPSDAACAFVLVGSIIIGDAGVGDAGVGGGARGMNAAGVIGVSGGARGVSLGDGAGLACADRLGDCRTGVAPSLAAGTGVASLAPERVERVTRLFDCTVESGESMIVGGSAENSASLLLSIRAFELRNGY